MNRWFCGIACLIFFVGCSSERSSAVPSLNAGDQAKSKVAEDQEELASEVTPAPQLLAASSESSSDSSDRQISDTVFLLAWNVESGGAAPDVIAERLRKFSNYDLFCLSEVHPSDFKTFEEALHPDFKSVISKSGNEDRLQILFNAARFELLETIELARYRDYVLNSGGHRSPTAVRLKDRITNRTLIVMVNHLARGNAEFRTKQAIGLREWARDQDTGVINVGDFNMDYEFATKRGNDALDEILRDNVWQWVKPAAWVDSNWWDPEGDRVDNFDGSLLDFVFVSGPAKTWMASCEVIVESGDFPDDATTSDHRPVSLQFTPTR